MTSSSIVNCMPEDARDLVADTFSISSSRPSPRFASSRVDLCFLHNDHPGSRGMHIALEESAAYMFGQIHDRNSVMGLLKDIASLLDIHVAYFKHFVHVNLKHLRAPKCAKTCGFPQGPFTSVCTTPAHSIHDTTRASCHSRILLPARRYPSLHVPRSPDSKHKRMTSAATQRRVHQSWRILAPSLPTTSIISSFDTCKNLAMNPQRVLFTRTGIVRANTATQKTFPSRQPCNDTNSFR